MTLPRVRALGKTREGGKKKKTPIGRERNNVYGLVWVHVCMCVCVDACVYVWLIRRGTEQRS